jgi:replicative DNA helicase
MLRREVVPHMVEAEQQVLGICLLVQDCVGRVMAKGGAGLFFDPVHAEIFEALAEKDKGGEFISPVTMADTLRGSEGLRVLGGPSYLARLAGSSMSAAALPSYLTMLADLRDKRKIGAVMAEAQASMARGEDSAALIASRLEAGLIEIEAGGKGAQPVSMLKAVVTAMDQIHAAYSGEEWAVVRSGIVSLDRMVSGFYPGELILIGGRPSMGKSGLALSIALNAARAGHGVVMASLEMNPEAMAMRALAEATGQAGLGVAYSGMRRGDLTEAQVRAVQHAAKGVGELPFMFLPRQFADIGALFAGAKQARRTMGDNMRLLIVDYAQLLRSQAKSRYEQITEISIALKALAGQLNVPVIALSQLSRAVETRDEKRPMMSDLRESGQLEQDADAVMFCYRDEYYVERMRPEDNDLEAVAEWQTAMERCKNRLEIIVAKQRQGEIGTAHCRFNPALNLVWEDGL